MAMGALKIAMKHLSVPALPCARRDCHPSSLHCGVIQLQQAVGADDSNLKLPRGDTGKLSTAGDDGRVASCPPPLDG